MAGVGGLTTPQAAPLFKAAWLRKFGREPTPTELQGWLCVSRFDGGYGSWPAGSSLEGSHNMGGVQAGGGRTSGPGWHAVPFATWELENGKRVEHPSTPFKFYDTWEGGIADHLDQMTGPRRPLTQAALASGSLYRVADAMHREHYFTARVDDYAAALWRQATPIASMLGVPLAVRPGSPAELAPSAVSSAAPLLLLAAAAGLIAWQLGVFD
jgi:hypothetical protein